MGFLTNWLNKSYSDVSDFETISDEEKAEAEDQLDAAMKLAGLVDALELAGFTHEEAMQMCHAMLTASLMKPEPITFPS